MLGILSDLDEWLTAEDVPRPVVLLIDGYSGHLPEMALCMSRMKVSLFPLNGVVEDWSLEVPIR